MMCDFFADHRDDGIRTHDLFFPKEARYQAAPHPDQRDYHNRLVFKNPQKKCSGIISYLDENKNKRVMMGKVRVRNKEEVFVYIWKEEEKYDGYYAIATNLDDDCKDILAIVKKRYKIEECFRIMKTDFAARPVNHSIEKHIRANFLICYTALLIFRILETELNRSENHTTTENILKTLKNMNVSELTPDLYKAEYTDSKALQRLLSIYNMKLGKKFYSKKMLNSLVK